VILDVHQFLSLRESLPVVDVRSEGEYLQGHIPSAINIPLLNNEERVVVGTTYKKNGQKDAIKEGFRLVGPRLHALVEDAAKCGEEFIVHCWRGGMRSSNFCQFAGMAGIKTHQLQGGYKAYRGYAIESFTLPLNLHVISGYTGSGKSEVLRTLREKGEQVIDLESLARHKGSVFGGLNMPPQPSTEQFQNDLFETLLTLDLNRRIWIEDESIAIGRIFLPPDFWANMNRAPIVQLNVSLEERVLRLAAEYRDVPMNQFHQAMKGIIKRLGGQNFNWAEEKLFAGDLAGAIEIILNYYDKAYANGMDKKKDRLLHTITWDGRNVTSLAEILMNEELPLPRTVTP
jgi:tRNA 2-selenouridine synthase